MNPLSKIIRSRKTAKAKTTDKQQATSEAPRPLDEAEMKLVGGGSRSSTGLGTISDPDLPKGKWEQK